MAAKIKKDPVFEWEGIDKRGKKVSGEITASGIAFVNSALRRQGITIVKVKKQSGFGGKAGAGIKPKDVSLFTRQLATMMKSGVPLLQSFDIVGKGNTNKAVSKLLMNIKADIESGSSLSQAFKKHPLVFDDLYCNLVDAGEKGGILDTLLDRLASYKEKTEAIKGKIKSALIYPISIIVVAFVITAVIMIFVVPAFTDMFSSFGAELPMPTQVVIKISNIFVNYWWAIFGAIGGSLYGFFYMWKRSKRMQSVMDRALLRAPIFGSVIRKATIARFTRTLATMFAAGVPLVESLESVAGACGNRVYYDASKEIQKEVSAGTNLTVSMQNTTVFPNMVIQMVSIGEESGSLDSMLSKVADFYEGEVDDAVAAMASLMEPVIMVVLGVLIGGLVVALYMPIFKMGSVVGG